MYDVISKYTSYIFGDFSKIKPSPEIIKDLLDIFKEEAFLPSTVQEITTPNPQNKLRIRLSSQDGQWNITFLTKKIEIEFGPATKINATSYPSDNFCCDTNKYFKKILEKYPIKIKRISLIISGLLRAMTSPELEAIYRKVFNPINYYETHIPFEWEQRTVAGDTIRINDKDEEVNVICYIKRLSGDFTEADTTIPFDRIAINTDINTSHKNLQERFEINDIAAFYESANIKHKYLLSQIQDHLK